MALKRENGFYPLGNLSQKCKIGKLNVAEQDGMLPLKSIVTQTMKNLKQHLRNFKASDVKTIVNKEDMFRYITSRLDIIIPNEFFGCSKNRGKFYCTVKKIVTATGFECEIKTAIVSGYLIDRMKWLEDVANFFIKRAVLMEAVIWMLDLTKRVIRTSFAKLNGNKSHEFVLVPRSKNQRYKDKVKNKLIECEFVEPVVENVPMVENQIRGELQFTPKKINHLDTNSIRIIMHKKHDEAKHSPDRKYVRKLNKKLYQISRRYSKTIVGPIYKEWKQFVNTVKSKQVFAIKLDLHDAFGLINIDTLVEIINNEKRFLSKEEREHIINHIVDPTVSIGRVRSEENGKTELVPRNFIWKHGLLQGDRLSSSLCCLYTSYYDKLYLEEFYTDHSFMHKTTDDFFYCSTNRNDVIKFELVLNSIYKLNYSKKETNLIQLDKKISYAGYIFDMSTLEISGIFVSSSEQEIRHRCRLWNMKKTGKDCFLGSAIERGLKYSSNNFHFNIEKCNLDYNTFPTFMNNFYEGMILIGFKLDYVMKSIMPQLRSSTAKKCAVAKIYNHIQSYPKAVVRKLRKNNDNNIPHDYATYEYTLQALSFAALITVFKKRNETYRFFMRHFRKLYRVYSTGIHKEYIYHYQEIVFKLPEKFGNMKVRRVLKH